MAAATLTAGAQETMYLVKGDHVVGKYAVDDVDYVTFNLPDDVKDGNVWVELVSAGKNTVKYNVNTTGDDVAYAHNILTYWEVNYMSLEYFGKMFDMLSQEETIQVLQTALSYNAYMAMGTNTFEQTDYDLDGTGPYSHFTVTPGTHFFLCAWELDPSTGNPLDTFVFTEFNTKPAGESTASSSVAFKRQNEQGLAFEFTADRNVKYFRTLYGNRSVMEQYIQIYGEDFTFGTFGQNFTLEQLSGFNPEQEIEIENATWPAYDSGEYVLYVRAYDYNGDMTQHQVFAEFVDNNQKQGPKITIFSRSKSQGKVSLNFEISPSNVEEAYVRMMLENDVDDRLNMGYELHELAMGGDATDITSDINTNGEYTFNATMDIDEQWRAILITALDKDGNRTTQRINFNQSEDTEWSDYNPVYSAPAVKAIKPVKTIKSKRNPSISRLK